MGVMWPIDIISGDVEPFNQGATCHPELSIHPSLMPIREGHVSPPKEDTCHHLTLATCQLLNRARLANRAGDVSRTLEVWDSFGVREDLNVV
jgi:hypothetical protein